MIPSEIMSLFYTQFPQIAETALQEEIASVGKVVEAMAGDKIMDYGGYIQWAPLILRGTVKVMREGDDGNELFLYFLNPGDTCPSSFSCCMMHKQSIIRAVIEEDTLLIGIPYRYLDDWMSKYRSWKNFIMLSYDDRVLQLVKTIDTIAFKKMDQRLLDYLYKKSEALKSPTIFITHQEIAHDLNASREAVSRLLKQLEKMGELELGRNRIDLREGG